MTDTKIVGTSVPRAEGPDKVTGRTRYAADIPREGLLWGKILRSPHPHARIRRIDADRARSAPGVKAVVTGQDVPNHFMGKQILDMPVLCWDRVRYIGDRVAAVAAETPEAAEAALGLIEVDYEVLPTVFDPLAATEPGAPLIHDDVAGYDGAPHERLATDVHNGLTRLFWSKGDVEQGFREADVTLEHTFRVPGRHQGYLEPHAGLLAIDPDGRLQVWACTKDTFRTRRMLAGAIGVEPDRIRVHPVNVGGEFGGKGDARDLPIAFFLARESGRPVKIVMNLRGRADRQQPRRGHGPDRPQRREARRPYRRAQAEGVARRRRLRRPQGQRLLCHLALRRRPLPGGERHVRVPPDLHQHHSGRVLPESRIHPHLLRAGVPHRPHRPGAGHGSRRVPSSKRAARQRGGRHRQAAPRPADPFGAVPGGWKRRTGTAHGRDPTAAAAFRSTGATSPAARPASPSRPKPTGR